ncbi:MAG: DUF2911 domain-containing protein [Bacteroidota bacterium]
MNKIAITICLLLAIVLPSQAQSFSDLDKSPMDALMIRSNSNAPLVRIIYSRPEKRGRNIFGKLVPYDKLWRTGANEATEIRFYRNCLFNGEEIAAGTYTFYTIPGENEWVIIINKVTQAWGTESYKQENDVLRTTVQAYETATTVEQFSMSVRANNDLFELYLGWDDTYLKIPIQEENKIKPEKLDVKSIKDMLPIQIKTDTTSIEKN